MVPEDPEDVVQHVGRRIAALREQKGLSQEEVAAEASVTVKYVQRIEAGRENLSIRSMVRWANLFDVRVVELLRGRARPQKGRGRPVERAPSEKKPGPSK